MSTVCLNMIVRNESGVIRRCLDAVAEQIDYWVIVDTGSEDNTADVIRDYFEQRGIPGELHQRAWVNFGHNRTEALQLAQNKADYLLLCDADMVLEVHSPDWKQRLSEDAYLVVQTDQIARYHNLRLLSARLPEDRQFRYFGATHEFLAPARGDTDQFPVNTDISFQDFADGGARGDKHQRDLKLLGEELTRLERSVDAEEQERLLPRTLFYLANTHYYLQHWEPALALYERRAGITGGFEEEIYCALLQAGRCRQRLNRDWPEVESPFLEAWRRDKRRVESLLPVVWHYQDAGDFETSYGYSALGAGLEPPDALFVETAAYRYHLPAAHALNCMKTGRRQEAADTCRRMIASGELTSRQQEWAESQLTAAQTKPGKEASSP